MQLDFQRKWRWKFDKLFKRFNTYSIRMDYNKCIVCFNFGGAMSIGTFFITTFVGLVLYTVAIDFIAEGMINVYI